MNLEEYCDILNIEIRVLYYPNQGGRWCAAFEYAEVLEGTSVLVGAHGNGRTPHEAMTEYLDRIRGQKIVLHAGNQELRREYVVPASLTV